MRRVARLASASTVAVLLFAAHLPAQTLQREVTVGPELLIFKSEEGRTSAVAGRLSGSLFWTRWLGQSLALAIEPRGGLRVLGYDMGESAELVGEVVERLVSAPAGRRLRWQLTAQQKARALSETPPLPAYLEPSRFETWVGASAAVPLVGRWELEGQGTAGLVRYGPEEWRVLDRTGAVASLGLTHPLAFGVARLSVATGGMSFADASASDRDDVRSELRLDWATSGTVFLQVQAGLAWNNSSLAGFDFRSHRAALLLSAPLGSASVQLFAAVARKTYQNLGPPDARVAPSDQDMGSIVVLQLTETLPNGVVLHLRGGWTRSETGFRNVFFERLALSALFSFRKPES